MGEANRREELIIYNFEEGREAEVVKGENFFLDYTRRYIQEGFFAMDQDLRLDRPMISRQAFVLVKNEYSSEPPLYFVRGGSEDIWSDTVQNGRPPEISKWSPLHTDIPPVPDHIYWYLPPLAVPVQHHLSSFLFL